MAKKNYNCIKCNKVIAKLETECGNLLHKDLKMICNSCYQILVTPSYSNKTTDDIFREIFYDNKI